MPILLDLFLTFAKIGAFTFGGGYAMIPLIENDCVEKKGWISHDDMMYVTVIAESTPGPVAINCSTFVGYRQAGLLGAAVATVGMVLPSFLVIFAISLFLDSFLEITLIANAFKGIKIAVGWLIINAAVNMVKKMKKSALSLVLLGIAFALMLVADIFSWNFSSILFLLGGGIVGLVAYLIRQQKEEKP